MALAKVELDRSESVAIIRLSRPPVNALDPDMIQRIDDLADAILEAPTTTAVVLSSSAPNFSAGADLRWIQRMLSAEGVNDRGREAVVEFTRKCNELFEKIAALPVLTIAAINGAALGGGLELALACDVRVAEDNATVGLPEVGVGLYPAGGGLERLREIAGLGTALELGLTGEPRDAGWAERRAIVQYLCPVGQAEALALKVANKQATMFEGSIAAVKMAVFDQTSDSGGGPSHAERVRGILQDPDVCSALMGFGR
jgi:enoyl-CoA hydratase/carnithine racemase